MELTDEVKDRAAGVLLGQATGDALGVPYEFAAPIRPGEAEMIGGGLGPYEPGEWSDDTQMALCIARVAATGDLTGPAALDEVAAAFIDWRLHGASDIGNQTATVLGRARHDDGTRLWERMTAIATDLAGGGSAGNGGLMRTSVVGLVALGSADRTAEAARLVCSLTHAEQRCVESSVLWSLAVRHAVLTGEADVRCGLGHLSAERRDWWTARIEEAETRPPSDFTPNGYTVTAFQAAWASIHATRDADDRVMAALQLAISIGNDTDTVAAIAGGLLGAACGASRIPGGLAEQVHGWPGMDAKDLVGLGLAIAAGPGRESM